MIKLSSILVRNAYDLDLFFSLFELVLRSQDIDLRYQPSVDVICSQLVISFELSALLSEFVSVESLNSANE